MADGDLELLEQDPDVPHPLGRHLWHDPNNRRFGAVDLPMLEAEPRKSPWYTRDVYDQIGSSCTVNSAIGVARTQPFTRSIHKDQRVLVDSEEERFALYLEAQQHDPWEGGEYPGASPRYEGSSTDAPFKVLRNRGAIKEWRWLFGVGEIKEHLMHRGPCSVGTVWRRNMFVPNAKGVLSIDGEDVGGHAYRWIYYDQKQRRFLIVNSWSRAWGLNGRAWLPEESAVELVEVQRGEAATIVL